MSGVPNTPIVPKGVAHVCRHCGHQRKAKIIERAWELLCRCPVCDAYDWEPEPEDES